MDLEARAFFGEHHRATLATVRADGRPQGDDRRDMETQRRVVVRIDIERAGPDRQG
ncbi:MAG: pyridoxamine 5'-phosphate oxidase family protein [Acidimicrobiales bacterium]